MALKYVTDGPWGAGLHRELDANEIDTNFWEVLQSVLSPDSPVSFAEIPFTVVGSTFYFHLNDATSYGPFDLPVATMHFQFEWTADSLYNVNDLITAPNSLGGLWIVTVAHDTIGETEFDPDATEDPGSGPVARYLQILPTVDQINVVPYDLVFKIGGTTPESSEVIAIIPIPLNRSVLIGANFVNAVGYVGTNPDTPPFVMEVKDDGIVIGTVSVNGSGISTYATTGGVAKNVAGGSILTVHGPSTADTAIKNSIWNIPARLVL